MAFDLTVNESSNLVTVTYNADTSYQDRVDVLNKLVDILQNNPEINILIDTRNAEENMTYHEQLDYGSLIVNQKQYFSANKTAILSVRGKNPHPIILTKTYLDGFNNICEFDIKNEALAWINGEIK